MSGDARSRAAEVLDVPIEATPNAVISAFLIQLAKTEFVPAGNVVAALNTLSGLGVPVNAENSGALRDEVEEFAQRYWTLAPPERLSRWLALCTRSPDDATANRLLSLQAGLELPVTPYADVKVEQITGIARELYVLPLRERAIRRCEWLLANAGRHRELIEVAATIQKNHPIIAALDPALFARLSPQFHAGLFAEAAAAKPLPEKSFVPSEPIVYPPGETTHTKPTPKYPPRRTSPSSKRGSPKGFFVFFLLIFALRALTSFTGPSAPSNQNQFEKPSNSPYFRDKKSDPVPYLMRREGKGISAYYQFTEDQVESFKNYEEEHKKGRFVQVPLFYADWLRTGKPEASEIIKAIP